VTGSAVIHRAPRRPPGAWRNARTSRRPPDRGDPIDGRRRRRCAVVGLLRGRLPFGSLRPFLLVGVEFLFLDRAQTTNMGVHRNELVAEALETAKLRDLAFGLAGSGGVRQRFGYCFATGLISQPQIGTVGRAGRVDGSGNWACRNGRKWRLWSRDESRRAGRSGERWQFAAAPIQRENPAQTGLLFVAYLIRADSRHKKRNPTAITGASASRTPMATAANSGLSAPIY
jgi:hypothetical protein